MIEPKYLEDESYYSELYDKHTVERCREIKNLHLTKTKLSPIKEAKLSPKQQNSKDAVKQIWKEVWVDVELYYVTGERYLNKQKAVVEWMVKDKAKDDKLAKTSPPDGIYCNSCHIEMNCWNKYLNDWDDSSKVLFLFKCPVCDKRRAVFKDGKEFESNLKCKKCQGEYIAKEVREGNIITITYGCTKCPYKETETIDLTQKKEKEDPNFLKDKERFCMTPQQGTKYLEDKITWPQIKEFNEKHKDKEKHKELYDKVAKIKKLGIVELEKLLAEILGKEGYIKLEISTPSFDRYVVINFTVRDSQSGRSEYDSQDKLKKLLNKTLLDTNWRLMSDGISYRLGFLSGRLKGYEREEDLLDLMRKVGDLS